jgi:hypothetical protein
MVRRAHHERRGFDIVDDSPFMLRLSKHSEPFFSNLLVEAAKVLETYRISSMPVGDGGRLVGMLTVTDVLRIFVEQNEDRQERKPLSEQTVTS